MSQFDQAKADFIAALPQSDFEFASTLSFIDTWFDFTPSAFDNGGVKNGQDQNQGSCKVFALSELLSLSKEQTLQCFGEHYRDVLATPDVDNHHNLRRVLRDGTADIHFDSFPLKQKS